MNQHIPLRMAENRVWRIYLGGKLLDELRGVTGSDGYFPEDWLASVVQANNPDREEKPDREGLSRVELPDGETAYLKDLIDANPEALLGKEHIANFGVNFGVLTKFLDSAERLPIQVHPDKHAAKALFGSDYGKTEAWCILGGRTIDSEEPYILLGFKEDTDTPRLRALFDAQDIQGMAALMHKIPVKAGEVYLITGGTPHAIGPGCFLLEIQEPTDYTISLEKCNTLGEKLPDFLCHQGLGFEKMFDCFNYINYSRDELLNAFCLTPVTTQACNSHTTESLLSYDNTPCFALNRLTVRTSMPYEGKGSPCALAVIRGAGKLAGMAVRAGDCFFVSAATESFLIESAEGEPLTLLECLPPLKK